MDIYWIENKQKHGPITVPDVIARVQMGELNADTTLGWHNGCEKWLPLKELPALADFLAEMQDKSKATPPPEEEKDELGELLISNEQKKQQPLPPIPVTVLTQPSPGRRFLARLTDYAIYAALVMSCVYLLKLPFNEFFIFSQPTFWLPSIIIEAILLSNYGTTPGKRLMGISVRSLLDGNPPPMRYALSRALGVFIMGMGCFMPPISVIMMCIAVHMVHKGSLTLWDNRARSITLSHPEKRPAPFLCCFIIFLSIQIVSYCTAPWIPDMIQQIAETSPELADWLRQNFPTEVQ